MRDFSRLEGARGGASSEVVKLQTETGTKYFKREDSIDLDEVRDETFQDVSVEGRPAIVIELRVAPEDMGKVIGKQGRIAKAIRTVVKAAATKANKKVVVEILQ